MSVTYTTDGKRFETQVPLLIVGAGAAGLCAALAAKEAGVEAVLIERDAVPSGSTALSAGLIPAAGTRFQRDKAIVDSADLFAADIQRKAHGESDQAIVDAVARGSGPLIEWLADQLRLALRCDRQLQLPGSFRTAHARPSDPHRAGIDRPPAQRRRSQRHRHSHRTRSPSGCSSQPAAALPASKSCAATGRGSASAAAR